MSDKRKTLGQLTYEKVTDLPRDCIPPFDRLSKDDRDFWENAARAASQALAESDVESTGLLMKYFVLKPGGNDAYAKASRAAMRKYADFIEGENPELAHQIRDWADTEAAKVLSEDDRSHYQR